MDGDPLNKVISLVIAAIVGIVMIVGAFLPIAAQQIAWATGSTGSGSSAVANIPGLDKITGGSGMITALLSVVVIMVIVGLIVGVVSYLRSDR